MFGSQKIIGHQKQIQCLEKDIKNLSTTHAYLFSGPKSLGKALLAKSFAKSLLCEGDLSEGVDATNFDKGINADFLELKDEGVSLKIDEIRSLNTKIHLSPQGKKRVVFIENIERMPIEAQNAFLKSLEEPGDRTMFILTSSQIKQVLPTIISRVRHLEFQPLSNSELKTGLLEFGAAESQLESILKMAQGRPGRAIEAIQNPTLLSESNQVFSQLNYFFGQNGLLDKFIYVEEIEKDADKLEQFFNAGFLAIKELINQRVSGKKGVMDERYSLEELTELFEKLIKTRYLTRRNVNKKLALENFFLATEK